MFGLSPWELLIILAIVLLLFGGKRLKNLGGDLGTSIKGFKKAMKDDSKELESEKEDSITVESEEKQKAE